MNRRYEQGKEFNARQGWLDLGTVVVAVMEISAEIHAAVKGWFGGWLKAFKTPAARQPSPQMPLPLHYAPT